MFVLGWLLGLISFCENDNQAFVLGSVGLCQLFFSFFFFFFRNATFSTIFGFSLHI